MELQFKIGLVQMAAGAKPAASLAKAIERVEEAARQGAELVCLPELFRSQYFCQREDHAAFDLAEPIPGPTTEALGKVARHAQVVVIAPIFERRAAGLYHNSAAVIDADGRIAGLYRKMHIPDDPAYYEKFYFTPGDLGFPAFETSVGRIGTLICWDQWYPEGARLEALRGANVLFYPTAIGWHPNEKAQYGAAQHDAWRTIQRAHAIANGVYVAAVNRVGFEPATAPSGAGAGTAGRQGRRGSSNEPEHGRDARATKSEGQVEQPEKDKKHGSQGIEFWGSSFITDPFGIVLAEASADREEILLGEIDLSRIEEVRRNWPFLRDRRIDAYGGIERRQLDDEPKKP